MQPPALALPPINEPNHAMTRFVLRRLERQLGIQIRLHGLSDQFAMGSGIVVANHFTRLETFVIPFVLHRALNLTVRILAAPMLFDNAVFGDYLMSIGALPTNYPNKYDLIARDILGGGWWLIFPEGGLIKDRKVMQRGRLNIAAESGAQRRRPRSGAAILALAVQRYKAVLRQAMEQGRDIDALCTSMGLRGLQASAVEALAYSPTPIVPLNVTYYPLNPQENAIKSLATHLVPQLAASDFGRHLLEELTVEGSMLLKGVDIDMRLGTPLLVVNEDVQHPHAWRPAPGPSSPWRQYLNTVLSWRPVPSDTARRQGWMAWQGWQQRRRAWHITRATMQAVYNLTTVNMDHLLAILLLEALRTRRKPRLAVAAIKHSIYLAVQRLQDEGKIALHPTLTDTASQYGLLTDAPQATIENFVRRAVANHLLRCEQETWILNAEALLEPWSFGTVRLKNFIQVSYNEIEPVQGVIQIVRHAMRRAWTAPSSVISEALFVHEQQRYEVEYTAFAMSARALKITPLPHDWGRPVLLQGQGAAGRTGVLLMHGYSASPGEVLPLGQALQARGLTVYIVRLCGHGTSPYALQRCRWQDWYESVQRGYTALQRITDIQFAGGMSMGGALALYLAAQRESALQGVFAVGAPIKLQQRAVRLAPLVKTVRDFVHADPANADTNYTMHPVQALHQLTRFIDTYHKALGRVTVPVLLIQARGDKTVRPESAQHIYDRIASAEKSIRWKDMHRHVIVGNDYPEVHDDIWTFLHQHMSRR